MTKAQEFYNSIKGKRFKLDGEDSFESTLKKIFKTHEFSKADKEELFNLINPELLKELNLTKAKFIKLG